MLNDHTDAEIARREHAYEMGEDTPDDVRWNAWTAEVEKLLGIETLDGDQLEDGYCLDFANVHFEDGMTPTQYAALVRETWHLNGDPT